AEVRRWMERAGMTVRVDDAGNIRGCVPGTSASTRGVIIGSHLDTVPSAGAFDGVLGVLLGIGLVELLAGRGVKVPMEVAGFSEEEGVRFGVPFIGSRALIGAIDDALLARRDAQGVSVAEAIRRFGLDPTRMPEAAICGEARYFELHIE